MIENKLKTWEQHFLNMSKRKKRMAMFWCKRSGMTYTAMQLIKERMLRTPYFSVCAYNDQSLMSYMKQSFSIEGTTDKVSAFDDHMMILDNGSYIFDSVGMVKADLLYVNEFNLLPPRAVGQLLEMNKLGDLNELLIATSGGNGNLEQLQKDMDIYVDHVDWRYIIGDLREFWTTDYYEKWKADLIAEIGQEQFDKDYENKTK